MTSFDYDKYKNMSFSSLIEALLSMSGTELSILASVIGYALTINTTVNEQDSLGNFFELLGQFILTSSAQTYKLQSNNSPSLDELQNQINHLYSLINKMRRN